MVERLSSSEVKQIPLAAYADRGADRSKDESITPAEVTAILRQRMIFKGLDEVQALSGNLWSTLGLDAQSSVDAASFQKACLAYSSSDSDVQKAINSLGRAGEYQSRHVKHVGGGKGSHPVFTYDPPRPY